MARLPQDEQGINALKGSRPLVSGSAWVLRVATQWLRREQVMADEPMLKFVDVGQAYPPKRAAGARTADFAEIAPLYGEDQAGEQASRCSQCGVPYCATHCPLHNHIPDWLRLTTEGRLREAYELSNATSTMPEICGRICPQDRLCEGNCVIEFSGHGAVTIGSVEKYITDTAWENGWVEPVVVGAARGQSVGVIGAGPAGLTTAELMRARGYEVHVYDRHDRAGGLLTYGIPGFKLEKPVVMRRVERLKDAGIVFHEGFEVGRDASLAELRARHDALLIATGVYKPRAIKAPGVGAPGVVDALDYLTASNRKSFGDAVPSFDDGSLNAEGKNVVVIGAAIPRWTACAPRSARARPRSNVSIAATAPICRARNARRRTPKRRASSSSGCRRPRRSRAPMALAVSARSGCGSASLMSLAAAPPNPIRAATSGSTPIW